MINEVIFDYIRKQEDAKDGSVNLPQSAVETMRNALFLALSYKGMNGTELCEDTNNSLATIKRAIAKSASLQSLGDMDRVPKLKEELKKSLLIRAAAITRLPTAFVDFLGEKKRDFDNKMLNIMNSKNILPKS
jgi:hypothetical protein